MCILKLLSQGWFVVRPGNKICGCLGFLLDLFHIKIYQLQGDVLSLLGESKEICNTNTHQWLSFFIGNKTYMWRFCWLCNIYFLSSANITYCTYHQEFSYHVHPLFQCMFISLSYLGLCSLMVSVRTVGVIFLLIYFIYFYFLYYFIYFGWCHLWPNFSKLANHQIRHQAIRKEGC